MPMTPIIREFRTLFLFCAIFLSALTLKSAQSRPPSKPPNPSSGAETYKEYCAVCHGKSGRGDGPAAAALKVRPPDITTLARRHGGEFPSAYVAGVLRDNANISSHGNAEMPIWGPLFQGIDSSYQSQVNLRISSLVNYIKSLQRK